MDLKSVNMDLKDVYMDLKGVNMDLKEAYMDLKKVNMRVRRAKMNFIKKKIPNLLTNTSFININKILTFLIQ